jgi:hypothetical protein
MRASIPATLTLLLAIGVAVPAGARHDSAPKNGRQCIGLNLIRDETAEADNRLIFHSGGGQAWRNYLPEPCENLRRINDTDKLKLRPTSIDQLCAGDSVEVLAHDSSLLGVIGAGDTHEVTCKLGVFEPTSEMSLTEELRR